MDILFLSEINYHFLIVEVIFDFNAYIIFHNLSVYCFPERSLKYAA